MEFAITIFLGFFSTLCYSLIQIVIKSWVIKLKLVDAFWDQVYMSIPYVLLCGLLGITGFVLWAFALQKVGIAQIYWVTSSAYIIIPIISFLFFKERITVNAIVGYGIIAIGGIFASNTK